MLSPGRAEKVAGRPRPFLRAAMGTGASLVEYETAASNSDKAQWPAAFAEIDKAVQEKKTAGVAEAEVLAYATEACASAALVVHLDTEYNAATGRG